MSEVKDKEWDAPIAGRQHIEPDNNIMPFGKYKGESMENVPAHYLDWLRDQDWLSSWPTVEAYIEDNDSRIDAELDEQNPYRPIDPGEVPW